jgi:hypothetical protein
VKWLGREGDHLPPSSADVKKVCRYNFTLPMPSWHSQRQLYLYLTPVIALLYCQLVTWETYVRLCTC